MSGVKPRENQVTLLVSFQENAAALIHTYQQQANMTMKLTILYTKHASAIEKDGPHLSFRYFHEKILSISFNVYIRCLKARLS